MPCTNPNVFIIFLSTPSARRATGRLEINAYKIDISIHALREEGDYNGKMFTKSFEISIHALREEGDARRTAPTA